MRAAGAAAAFPTAAGEAHVQRACAVGNGDRPARNRPGPGDGTYVVRERSCCTRPGMHACIHARMRRRKERAICSAADLHARHESDLTLMNELHVFL